jgi:hypothetical protein
LRRKCLHDSGVVDNRVEPVGVLAKRCVRSVNGVDAGEIQLDELDRSDSGDLADVGGGLLALLRRARGDEDVGVRSPEMQSCFEAHAGVAAGDEVPLAREVVELVDLPVANGCVVRSHVVSCVVGVVLAKTVGRACRGRSTTNRP